MCPPQDGEFVYEWSLERSAHADQGLQHEFDIECYDPTCVEECASPVQGECAGLVFPGGSPNLKRLGFGFGMIEAAFECSLFCAQYL